MRKTLYLPIETVNQLNALAGGKHSRSCIVSALASLMTKSKEATAAVRAEACLLRRGGPKPRRKATERVFPPSPPRATVKPAVRGLTPPAST